MWWHYHKVEIDRNIFYKRSEMMGAYISVEHHMTDKDRQDFYKRLDAVKLPKGTLPALDN